MVDPKSNKDVPVGEEGELWLRGPLCMMYEKFRENTPASTMLINSAGVISMIARQPPEPSPTTDGSNQGIF